MKGFCSYSVEGGPLYSPEADRAYLEALKSALRDDIPLHIRDLDINNAAFVTEAAKHLIAMLEKEN
jgi:uncharacterized protein (UPF0261 family)